MRVKTLIVSFLILTGLSSIAQSFTLDSSFQPYFNIRSQGFVSVSSLLELPSSKIIFVGNFSIGLPTGQVANSITSVKRNGSRNLFFNHQVGSGGNISWISDSVFVGSQGGHLLIDTNGNNFSPSWRLNYLNTVSCRTGIPYFFFDGSSLFANRKNGQGLPCDIINSPDTFPGRHIVKVDPQGNWDSTFNHDANDAPRGFVPYDSSQILVYGYSNRFHYYDSVKVDGLCRIDLNGNLDTSFHSHLLDTVVPSGGGPLLIDNNGKILLGGQFYLKNAGGQLYTLVRLNQDGSLDTTFMNASGPQHSIASISSVYSVAQTSDGGYLVGGLFTNYQGLARNSIAKIDSNGQVEPQYFTGLGPDSSNANGSGFAQVYMIEKSKFGGYYVGGDFLKWDGQPSQPIVRLHGLTTSVGLNETKQEKEKVLVFPNPFQESINIRIQDFNFQADYHYQIQDLKGRLLKSNIIKEADNNIQLSSLSKGTYLIVIFENGQPTSRQLILRQ